MADGTKTKDIRVNNRKRVINALFREGEMTKQELTARLDMSPPTVTVILKELSERGFIEKGEVLQSTGGRKPVTVKPVFGIKYSVGMEVSLHEIRIVMVDLGANIVVRERHPFGIQSQREYWEQVNCLLMEFIEKNIHDREKLLDTGIALQIPMDNGKIVVKDLTPQCCRIDLNMAGECFDIPVKFYGSAKAAAIAQVWNRDERENFVFVSVGSYIAGAMIYNGYIVDFQHLNGELGSIVVRKGHMEKKVSEYCTLPAMCVRAGVLSREEFFESVRAGEEACSQIWKEGVEVFADLLHNLHCIFGWKIIVGGSMCPYLEEYKGMLTKRLKELNDNTEQTKDYFQISDLGEFGASVGAALFSVDKFLEFGYEAL